MMLMLIMTMNIPSSCFNASPFSSSSQQSVSIKSMSANENKDVIVAFDCTSTMLDANDNSNDHDGDRITTNNTCS